MPTQAHVASIDSLDAFRARLIVFIEKALVAADDVLDDVSRTRGWLQHDQRVRWEAELRKRSKALENARQELLTARLANLRDAPTDKVMAVARAKRAFDEAQEKLGLLKKWNRQYDQEVGPLAKQVEKLRFFLATDLKRAASSLGQSVRTLEAYSERGGFSGTADSAPRTESSPAAVPGAEPAENP